MFQFVSSNMESSWKMITIRKLNNPENFDYCQCEYTSLKSIEKNLEDDSTIYSVFSSLRFHNSGTKKGHLRSFILTTNLYTIIDSLIIRKFLNPTTYPTQINLRAKFLRLRQSCGFICIEIDIVPSYSNRQKAIKTNAFPDIEISINLSTIIHFRPTYYLPIRALLFRINGK